MDCISCHTPAASGVLGVKTRQSNRDYHFASTGVTDNQLRTWNHIGLFDSPLDEQTIGDLSRLVTVTNTSVNLETRVRSYLDANCSHCHRPAAFAVPATISITVSASDFGGSVTSVVFFAGATPLGSDASGPFELTLRVQRGPERAPGSGRSGGN